jgi:short-subunit dehydrogenase
VGERIGVPREQMGTSRPESHALHVEGRPFGVKVTAVVAGGMRTPFLLDRFPDLDASTLQDPANVAATIRFLLTLPEETVIPEVSKGLEKAGRSQENLAGGEELDDGL